MTIRELIYDINQEIGLINSGDQVADDNTNYLTLKLINRVIASFNLQGYLKYNNQTITLTTVGSRYLISTNPVAINYVYYSSGSNNLGLDECSPNNIFQYHTSGTTPTHFAYMRGVVEDDAMFGEVLINVDSSQYELKAVISNEIPAYTTNDTILIPNEYLELILADVQYRLLSDADASETLVARKLDELNKIKYAIKRSNFKPITYSNYGMSAKDRCLSGVGRIWVQKYY